MRPFTDSFNKAYETGQQHNREMQQRDSIFFHSRSSEEQAFVLRIQGLYIAVTNIIEPQAFELHQLCSAMQSNSTLADMCTGKIMKERGFFDDDFIDTVTSNVHTQSDIEKKFVRNLILSFKYNGRTIPFPSTAEILQLLH